MLRVPLHKIEAGMILARPIPLPSQPRRFLLQRDHEIPLDLVPRLRQFGITAVWIRFRPLEFLEDVLDEGLDDRQREVYCHVRENFERVMSGAEPELDAGRFQSSIRELFEYLRRQRAGNFLLQKLDAFDSYLLSHSTNVCYLALLLGLKLEGYLIEQRRHKSARDAKDLQLLGLGCLLHDVGKMRLNPQILHKPGRLNRKEMAHVRRHPALGYEMVRGQVPLAAAEIILNHHQRFRGGGYPQRVDGRTGEPLPALCGEQISIFSRIATVVDVYDAATSRRVYSEAKFPVQALHEMRRWCEGYFDPVVERAFYEIIPPFPLGQVVQLSDGSEAVVVDFNPRRPVQPKVQRLRTPDGTSVADPSLDEIDLALYQELSIERIDGIDIRPFVQPHVRGQNPLPAAASS